MFYHIKCNLMMSLSRHFSFDINEICYDYRYEKLLDDLHCNVI